MFITLTVGSVRADITVVLAVSFSDRRGAGQ
jgi:hypothetical protein